MGLGFQRNNTLDRLNAEPVTGALVLWCKLFYSGTLRKSYVVFVSREYFSRALFGGFLDKSKEARLTFFSVYNKGAAENFMSTVFRIDLSEAKYLRIG